jgi:formate-dependent nitrite reductase membrane component NrfD
MRVDDGVRKQPALQSREVGLREELALQPREVGGRETSALRSREAGVEEVSYGYETVPMLKQPKWGWEIALYFFCEGISSGAYVLATLAELFGRGRFRRLSRAGYFTSLATLLPCPPLLIADLGRPERFHHMLRVFKPSSPMNLGAWALSGYSAAVAANAAKQVLMRSQQPQLAAPQVSRSINRLSTSGQQPSPPTQPLLTDGSAHEENTVVARMRSPVVGALGLPFAMTMLSYPGVLLATTSTPVWSKSRFLGALMATSSISTGAAATSLALALTANGDRGSSAVFAKNSTAALADVRALAKIETTARVAEGAALAAYIISEGDAARPLTNGDHKWHFWLGAVGAGLVLPVVIAKSSKSRTANAIGSALTLLGGLALKWAITHAGKKSALDNKAARAATRPSTSAPGW